MSKNSSDSSLREAIYYAFYTLAFVVSIYGGIDSGFTGTHTPPTPFVIELLALPIGLVLFIIDARMWRSTNVHKIGLAANGAIMVVVLFLGFAHIG
ncbi:MAG: hypothetical protein M3O71_20375 [Bacteroidota bacterium]|nr:hypothetical protein [Bacteroidota bacterium]